MADTVTNGTKGYEIHFNDAGECVTDHVYELADAKLIAAAPGLLEALVKINQLAQCSDDRFASMSDTIHLLSIEAIKKATE